MVLLTELFQHFLPETILSVGVFVLLIIGAWRGEKGFRLYLGDEIREKLIYYPTVTREPWRNNGRQTDLIVSGKLFRDIDEPPLDPATDRGMICGSPAMLKDTSGVLNHFGLTVSPKMGQRGDYLIERAFVDQ